MLPMQQQQTNNACSKQLYQQFQHYIKNMHRKHLPNNTEILYKQLYSHMHQANTHKKTRIDTYFKRKQKYISGGSNCYQSYCGVDSITDCDGKSDAKNTINENRCIGTSDGKRRRMPSSNNSYRHKNNMLCNALPQHSINTKPKSSYMKRNMSATYNNPHQRCKRGSTVVEQPQKCEQSITDTNAIPQQQKEICNANTNSISNQCETAPTHKFKKIQTIQQYNKLKLSYIRSQSPSLYCHNKSSNMGLHSSKLQPEKPKTQQYQYNQNQNQQQERLNNQIIMQQQQCRQLKQQLNNYKKSINRIQKNVVLLKVQTKKIQIKQNKFQEAQQLANNMIQHTQQIMVVNTKNYAKMINQQQSILSQLKNTKLQIRKELQDEQRNYHCAHKQQAGKLSKYYGTLQPLLSIEDKNTMSYFGNTATNFYTPNNTTKFGISVHKSVHSANGHGKSVVTVNYKAAKKFLGYIDELLNMLRSREKQYYQIQQLQCTSVKAQKISTQGFSAERAGWILALQLFEEKFQIRTQSCFKIIAKLYKQIKQHNLQLQNSILVKQSIRNQFQQQMKYLQNNQIRLADQSDLKIVNGQMLQKNGQKYQQRKKIFIMDSTIDKNNKGCQTNKNNNNTYSEQVNICQQYHICEQQNIRKTKNIHSLSKVFVFTIQIMNSLLLKFQYVFKLFFMLNIDKKKFNEHLLRLQSVLQGNKYQSIMHNNCQSLDIVSIIPKNIDQTRQAFSNRNNNSSGHSNSNSNSKNRKSARQEVMAVYTTITNNTHEDLNIHQMRQLLHDIIVDNEYQNQCQSKLQKRINMLNDYLYIFFNDIRIPLICRRNLVIEQLQYSATSAQQSSNTNNIDNDDNKKSKWHDQIINILKILRQQCEYKYTQKFRNISSNLLECLKSVSKVKSTTVSTQKSISYPSKIFNSSKNILKQVDKNILPMPMTIAPKIKLPPENLDEQNECMDSGLISKAVLSYLQSKSQNTQRIIQWKEQAKKNPSEMVRQLHEIRNQNCKKFTLLDLKVSRNEYVPHKWEYDRVGSMINKQALESNKQKQERENPGILQRNFDTTRTKISKVRNKIEFNEHIQDNFIMH